jgi:hypothetical protein
VKFICSLLKQQKPKLIANTQALAKWDDFCDCCGFAGRNYQLNNILKIKTYTVKIMFGKIGNKCCQAYSKS